MRRVAAKIIGTAIGAFALSTPPAYAETISHEAFGMHFHGMSRGGGLWPDVDFGFVRLWDSGVQWRSLEPTKGDWNFELLDRYVQEAGKRGVRVLLPLGLTPQWAALRPDSPSPYGEGASSEPRSLESWRSYVSTVALRYKGRIHAYEVWNEINVKHFWSGDLAKVAELERVAAEALKAADPAATVLSASVQGGAFRELDAYFKAGGGRYADAISYHFYAPTAEPEVLPERIRKVREIMAQHGLAAKPLWNTEFGWLIPNRDGSMGKNPRPVWKTWRKTDRLEAAGFVLRANLLALSGGVRHNFWYAWDNGAMGLAEDQGRTPKPAATGFVRAREWLIGANFGGCTRVSGVWQCTLERDGRSQWIVWSDAERSFTPPAEWQVRTSQGLFDPAPTSYAANLRVGPLPALLSR